MLVLGRGCSSRSHHRACRPPTSFAFKSGVLITKAARPVRQAQDQRSEAKAAPAARSAWGAAKPRVQAIDEEEDEAAPVEAAPAGAPAAGAPETETDNAGTNKVEAKVEPKTESKAKLQRGSDGKAVAKHIAPFSKWFRIVKCGGEGDCFYIAAGRGLHHVSPSGRAPPVNAFEAKGPIQGHLRMLVQRAGMKKTFGTTSLQAEYHGTTGNAAGALTC